ncbi:MAG: N-acetylmuramoyl-L-alanine amidase, partial [Firmicutes bacterium]|nr:N-acetylmuramoyl-L-alanine amidase [Bacillota bacterium]
GGNDPGAIAANGTREANLTIQIGLKLADLLRAAGADVMLTRTTAEENPDKYARPRLANDAGADALVSIHLNANYRSTICGSECYYYHAQSRPLAEAILSRLLDELGRPDGGVRWADLVVTREARMPACLVEALYMSNPTELALIMTPGTLDRIARAAFEGLEDYFAAH